MNSCRESRGCTISNRLTQPRRAEVHPSCLEDAVGSLAAEAAGLPAAGTHVLHRSRCLSVAADIAGAGSCQKAPLR